MQWKWIYAAALIAVPSAVYGQNATMAASARKIIMSRLIDPRSLQIRSVQVKSATSTDGRKVTILCGEYNAKNRLGGFAGFHTFIYEPTVMKGILSFDDSLAMDFISANGSGDLSHDPEGAIMAGADSSALGDAYGTAMKYAMVYLPVCLGAS